MGGRRVEGSNGSRLAHRDDVQAPMVKRIDEYVEVLVAGVQNSEPMERVINVVGKSGVGKATLVREVYESPKTRTLFQERVWASFPRYLSVSNILQLIYQQLEDKNTWCRVEDVDNNVQEKLKGKKFLLVIDGEVTNVDWMALLSVVLPRNDDRGCRVVRIMQGTHTKPPDVDERDWISVPDFEEDETKGLFQKWVPKEGIPRDKLVSRQILNKNQKSVTLALKRKKGKPEDNITEKTMDSHLHRMTGGLPLAVALLGGLLRTKEYPNEWLAVLKHLNSKQSDQSKRLDTILTMCFDDLPHDLKSCFLYFAVLPMNTPVDAHKLVCMWMAEGFLRPKDGKTMEKLGRIYLKDLVARNLVKVVRKDPFSGDQFVGVHHKVHEFLQLEAHEANFVDIHNGYDTPSLTTARRLSLQNYTDKYAALANSLPKLRSIQSSFQEVKGQGEDEENGKNKQGKYEVAPDGISGSGMFRCWGQGIKSSQERIKSYMRGMLQESRFLRVINLQGVEIGKKLPAAIGNVAHLQYLGVTACSLEFIPPAIGELKDLQTLDVRNTMVQNLPKSFWKIETLRHVFGSGLILPKKVGNLQHLQTLETIQPDKNYGWDGKTFERMVHLQALYLWEPSSERTNIDALCGVIKNPMLLEYLEKLVLKVSTIPCEVFTSPSQRRLRAMALCGKLEWTKRDKLFRVPNLAFLSLEGTKVSQGFIRILGKLPLLANLILDKRSYKDDQGQLVFGNDEFKSLKKLTLSHLRKVMRLVIRETALPELTDLVILSYNENINIEVKRKCECVEQSIQGEDEAKCRRCKLVEKIKDEDVKLYKIICQGLDPQR
nr:unnamed protein product [Digitaria exilis]